MALEIFFFMRSKRLGDTVSVNNCLGAYAQAGILVPAAPRPMGLLPTRSGGDDSIDVLVPYGSQQHHFEAWRKHARVLFGCREGVSPLFSGT